jgi:hypothetical protein
VTSNRPISFSQFANDYAGTFKQSNIASLSIANGGEQYSKQMNQIKDHKGSKIWQY